MTQGSRDLHPLIPGDHVYVQNQYGNNPKQWGKTGIVVEVGPHHSYTVRIDGSRTATKRNRKFLRKYSPPVLAPSPTQVSRPSPPPRPAPVKVLPPRPVNLDPEHSAAAQPARPRPRQPGTPQPPTPPVTSPRSSHQWAGAQPAPYQAAQPALHHPLPYPPHNPWYTLQYPLQNAVMTMLPQPWYPHYQHQDSITEGGGTSTKLKSFPWELPNSDNTGVTIFKYK